MARRERKKRKMEGGMIQCGYWVCSLGRSYTLLTVVSHIPNRGGGHEISKKNSGWSLSLS